MKSAYILSRQHLNLVVAICVKKSILTKPAIRRIFPYPVTYDILQGLINGFNWEGGGRGNGCHEVYEVHLGL